MQDERQICSIINENLLKNIEVQGGGIEDIPKLAISGRINITEGTLVEPLENVPVEPTSILEDMESADSLNDEKDNEEDCETLAEESVDTLSKANEDNDLSDEVENEEDNEEQNNCSEELEIEENGETMEHNEVFTVDDIIEETPTTVVCRPEVYSSEDVVEETPATAVCSPNVAVSDVAAEDNDKPNEEQIEEERRARREFAYKLSNLETLPIRKSEGQISIESLIEECGVTETSDARLDRAEGVEVVSLTSPWIVQKLVSYGCGRLDLGLLVNNGDVSRKANKLFIIGAGDVSLYLQGELDCAIECDYITAYAYLQLHAIGISVHCPVIILNDRMSLRGGYQI